MVSAEKPKEENSNDKIEKKQEENDDVELDKETIKQITMFPAPEGHQISSATKKSLLDREDE